jgi:hypothetical protein
VINDLPLYHLKGIINGMEKEPNNILKTIRTTKSQDDLIIAACDKAGVKPAPKARELLIAWANKTILDR